MGALETSVLVSMARDHSVVATAAHIGSGHTQEMGIHRMGELG